MVMTGREVDYFNGILSDFLASDNFLSMKNYYQHANVSCLEHSVSVAYLSYRAVKKFGFNVDEQALIRGALLHDFFLYDWHDRSLHNTFHGYRHPRTALKKASAEFELNKTEQDIIKKHMFPLVPSIPRYKESFVVSLADKVCSVCETLRLYPRTPALPAAVREKIGG